MGHGEETIIEQTHPINCECPDCGGEFRGNITLQYYNGVEWVNLGTFFNENNAWTSLGGDTLNYRIVDEKTGEVIKTSKEIS